MLTEASVIDGSPNIGTEIGASQLFSERIIGKRLSCGFGTLIRILLHEDAWFGSKRCVVTLSSNLLKVEYHSVLMRLQWVDLENSVMVATHLSIIILKS